MTARAKSILWAAKKIGDHMKFKKSCTHQSFIGQLARLRCQVRQPAIAIRR